MQRPTSSAWWGFGARNHGYLGFSCTIELQRTAPTGLIVYDLQDMLIAFVMILFAHVIDGDVGHPQDFGDVGIGVAIVGQQ